MQIKILGIFLAVILLVGGASFYQLNKELTKANEALGQANTTIGSLQEDVSACTAANKTNESTITSLSADHDKSKQIIAQMNTNPKVKIITVPAVIPHAASSAPVLEGVLLDALSQVGALQGAPK